jgi:hypothetical protein
VRPGRLVFAVVIPAALSAGGARAAELPVDPLAIPLVVLEAGAGVTAEAVDAVELGIAAPLLRGDALRRRLSLADPEDPSGSADFASRGERAADLFFAGDHDSARTEFEGLLAGIEDHPERLARDPDLRSVAFDARLFLAVIARQQGQEQLVDELLAGARRRYPELEPGTADFPPWLRERHGRTTAPATDGAGGVTVEVPEGCELSVDGRVTEPRAGGEALPDGAAHALRARCEGRPGPILVVPERAAPARIRPVALFSTDLAAESGEVVLAAQRGTGDAALIRDLLELARAAGTHRLAAVVGRVESIDLWLVDADRGGLARAARVARPGAAGNGGSGAEFDAALERAGSELAGVGGVEAGARQPWYRDGTAWAFTAAGLVAAGTGLILGRVYGAPSEQEPAAWALMAGGAALAATGVVLFLVPAPDDAGSGVAVSAGAAWSF